MANSICCIWWRCCANFVLNGLFVTLLVRRLSAKAKDKFKVTKAQNSGASTKHLLLEMRAQNQKLLNSVLSKAEIYAKYKMLLSKPYADRSYCPSKHFWAESGRSAALAGTQQYQITGEKE
jgi:hypothetical protein